MAERGEEELLRQVDDIHIWLEFGACQKTQLSLMSLGLSWFSAVAVSEYITDTSLNEEQCRQWLSENAADRDLPAATRAEVSRVLGE